MDIQEIVLKIAQLEVQGKKKEMIPLIEEMILQIEQTGDKELLISALNDYAGAKRDIGDLESSIASLEKAKYIAHDVYGVDHMNYGTLLANLANVQRVAKLFGQAEINFNKALDIYKHSNAPKDLVAGIKHNLAIMHVDNGNLETGYKLQMEELDLLKDDPETVLPYAVALQNIAATVAGMKDVPKALEYLNESQALVEKHSGEESSFLAGILNTRAMILTQSGNLVEAMKEFEKALIIVEKNYGNKSDAYESVKSNMDFLADVIKKELHS